MRTQTTRFTHGGMINAGYVGRTHTERCNEVSLNVDAGEEGYRIMS